MELSKLDFGKNLQLNSHTFSINKKVIFTFQIRVRFINNGNLVSIGCLMPTRKIFGLYLKSKTVIRPLSKLIAEFTQMIKNYKKLKYTILDSIGEEEVTFV